MVRPNPYIILTMLLLYCGSLVPAQRMTVVADVANIRSGPGISYDILWKVGKYHPLMVLKESGVWCYFRDFEGDEGWIHRSLLGNTAAIITINEKCNIRSGPGGGFNILFTVEKGIPFKVMKRQGQWIHIRHADGDQGWIHKSLVW